MIWQALLELLRARGAGAAFNLGLRAGYGAGAARGCLLISLVAAAIRRADHQPLAALSPGSCGAAPSVSLPPAGAELRARQKGNAERMELRLLAPRAELEVLQAGRKDRGSSPLALRKRGSRGSLLMAPDRGH